MNPMSETNGWPVLDPAPPSVPELSEDATPTEIASPIDWEAMVSEVAAEFVNTKLCGAE